MITIPAWQACRLTEEYANDSRRLRSVLAGRNAPDGETLESAMQSFACASVCRHERGRCRDENGRQRQALTGTASSTCWWKKQNECEARRRRAGRSCATIKESPQSARVTSSLSVHRSPRG